MNHLRAAGCGICLSLVFSFSSYGPPLCTGSQVPSTVVASATTISESDGVTAQFIFTLGGPVGNDTQLTLQFSGTAANGVDCESLPTQVAIPAGQTTATLTVTPIPDAETEGTETVTVTITASDNVCVYVGSPNTATVSITEAISPLATALDGVNLVWLTGGDAAWSAQSSVTHDGVDAAQSGYIFDNQESWLQTSVNGPGTLTFWWKVSSEADFDWLRFHIDGVLQQQISGEVNWQQRSFSLPQGSHTLRWRYVKDSNSTSGQDRAWLDQVSFTPGSGAPMFVSHPVGQIAWEGANVTLSAVALGAAPLSQQWYFNATNLLAGATNASLVLNSMVAAQTGQYRLVATNTLGSATSTIAAVTFTNRSPLSRVLLFSDSLVASPFQAALATLGQAYEGFFDEASFNWAVNSADHARTLVIVDAPQYIYTFSSLASFINGGGRVLIQAYSLVNSPTLATTFQVALENRSSTPLPLHDWGGSPLFTSLSSPVNFSEINLTEDAQRLHPLAGARAVAGFTSDVVSGEAAVVIGNGGRTIVNGFYAEGAASTADAIQLAQNEIAFLVGVAEPPEPGDGTFVLASPMSTARYGHTATRLTDGQVVVVGGLDGGFNYLASAELYTPGSGTWSNAASLTTERVWHTATLLHNGKVLVAGGVNSGGALVSAELYNPASGVWEDATPLNRARYWHIATLLTNGHVLVAGGFDNTAHISSAELYDPNSGTWTLTNDMLTGRSSFTATLLTNGQVLVAGGIGDVNGTPTANAELFDPENGTWVATDPLVTARDTHSASLLPNGQVLVAGGWNNNYHSSMEIYDPVSRSWTPGDAVNDARGFHSATMLFNGRLLLAGGQNDFGTLASAQGYDPSDGTWSATSPLMHGRQSHTETLLPNGKVLITGGHYNYVPLASAELWDSGTVTPTAIRLTGVAALPGGGFRFSFTNAPGLSFSVLASTDLTLPLINWNNLGSVTEVSSGQYQFTDLQADADGKRFYRVRSP